MNIDSHLGSSSEQLEALMLQQQLFARRATCQPLRYSNIPFLSKLMEALSLAGVVEQGCCQRSVTRTRFLPATTGHTTYCSPTMLAAASGCNLWPSQVLCSELVCKIVSIFLHRIMQSQSLLQLRQSFRQGGKANVPWHHPSHQACCYCICSC